MIDTDPDLQQQPELEGQEFGKYCFETFPKVRGSTSHIKVGGDAAKVCEIQITYNNPENLELLVEKVQKMQFEKQIFEPGVQLMEFVSMDLIGELHPPSSKGNRFALTTICMFTGYTFYIPIKNKSAEEIVTTWRNHVTFPFGVCRKLLMENGTEFKNNLFSRVAEQLGVERKIYSPPYRPQSNGRIEGFHKFLKSCPAKHISRHWEWDDVVPLATASYNWLPNQHSKESPFFVMFGRDAVTNLSQLTKPKLRYMGIEDLILDLELMSNIFQTQNPQPENGPKMCYQGSTACKET